MRAARLLVIAAACGDPADPHASVDASVDGAGSTWATYTIAPGAHVATVADETAMNPLAALTSVGGRDYEFIFDPSAMYELTAPVDPADQLDWNKLPGLSDCGTVDLAVDGAMFGWRWRLDLVPRVLEVTAYANNAGVHLTPQDPLVILDAEDLEAREPLRYRVYREPAQYRFEIAGSLRGRAITAATTISRRCTSDPIELLAWAAGFYFGGTSTAPSPITGRIHEISFVP